MNAPLIHHLGIICANTLQVNYLRVTISHYWEKLNFEIGLRFIHGLFTYGEEWQWHVNCRRRLTRTAWGGQRTSRASLAKFWEKDNNGSYNFLGNWGQMWRYKSVTITLGNHSVSYWRSWHHLKISTCLILVLCVVSPRPKIFLFPN